MTNKELERAKEIERSIETLDDLLSIINFPYPKMYSAKKNKKDKRTGFTDSDEVISFYCLDDKTRLELKESMHNIINKRRQELREELQNL